MCDFVSRQLRRSVKEQWYAAPINLEVKKRFATHRDKSEPVALPLLDLDHSELRGRTSYVTSLPVDEGRFREGWQDNLRCNSMIPLCQRHTRSVCCQNISRDSEVILVYIVFSVNGNCCQRREKPSQT